jgi:CheY-like chemotaxis protein
VPFPERIREDLVRAADELLEQSRSLRDAADMARQQGLQLRAAFARSPVSTRQPDDPRPILVVDEDSTSRKLLRVLLETEGYPVRAVADAELALLTVHEAAPRLVVTDLHLPGMSGLTLIRRLKAAPETRAIPIVVVTVADLDDELTRHALDAGAAVCYVKPIRPATFIRLVEAVIERGGWLGPRPPAS